jgi:hypothetical protein
VCVCVRGWGEEGYKETIEDAQDLACDMDVDIISSSVTICGRYCL